MTTQELIEKLNTEDGTEQELYDALVAEHGHDEAAKLWDSAFAEIEHDAAIEDATASLAELLTAVSKDLGSAANELGRLRDGGNAWHPDWAETTAGTDLETFLADAARHVRAAQAIHKHLTGG